MALFARMAALVSLRLGLRREALVVLFVAILTVVLLLTSAWLQRRLEAQITAIESFQLDRTLVGEVVFY